MSIPPISGLPPMPPVAAGDAGDAVAPSAPAAGDFGSALADGLQQVSNLEHRADAMATDVATGGSTKVHDLMIATTESSLAVDMLVQVRDRALDAYHEVMRLQL